MRLIVEGSQGKRVIVSGDTVQIEKKGGLFSSTRTKTLPIRNISSVEVKEPGAMFVGFIQFSIAGGKARDSSLSLSGGTMDAAKDENSVLFRSKDQYAAALKVKAYVENWSPPQPAPQVAAPVSTADEIRKLKALLDEGVLTADEFEAQKRQLLKP